MPWTEITPREARSSSSGPHDLGGDKKQHYRHPGGAEIELWTWFEGYPDDENEWYRHARIWVDGTPYDLDDDLETLKYYKSLAELFADGDTIADMAMRASTRTTRSSFASITGSNREQDIKLARYVYEIMRRGNPIEIVDYMSANDRNGSFDHNLLNPDEAQELISEFFDELLEDYSLTRDEVVSAPPVIALTNPSAFQNPLKNRLMR